MQFSHLCNNIIIIMIIKHRSFEFPSLSLSIFTPYISVFPRAGVVIRVRLCPRSLLTNAHLIILYVLLWRRVVRLLINHRQNTTLLRPCTATAVDLGSSDFRFFKGSYAYECTVTITLCDANNN